LGSIPLLHAHVRAWNNAYSGSCMVQHVVQHAQDRLPLPAALVVILTLLVCFVCGCGANPAAPASGLSSGAGGQSTTAPVPGETTTVTVLVSSTANDELTDFQLSFGTLTLTDAAGKSVTVFNLDKGSQLAEFIHSNSVLDPVISVSVPQDVYTSATLTFSNPQFSFVTSSAGYIYFNTAVNLGRGGFEPAAVTLPSAITVSGASMALVINSEVSQSVSMSGSPQENNFSSSVTPSFSITSVPVSSAQNAFGSGQVNAFGRIASLAASASGQNSLVLNLPTGTALTIASDGNTAWQGVNGYDSLSGGMFADIGVAIQADGTLLATRVEVPDPTARDLVTGPVFNIDPSAGIFNLVGEREQGQDFSSFRSGGMALQFTGNTQFRLYGGFQAPDGLPFTPVFDSTSIVAGQNVAVTSQSIPLSGPYPTATTMTLLPQTVDGTVDSLSSNNGFQVYEVSLASYDPLSATHGGVTLEVYGSSQTLLLNSTPAKPGQVLRFHGMVFSEQGSLEMVADQVNDGVAE